MTVSVCGRNNHSDEVEPTADLMRWVKSEFSSSSSSSWSIIMSSLWRRLLYMKLNNDEITLLYSPAAICRTQHQLASANTWEASNNAKRKGVAIAERSGGGHFPFPLWYPDFYLKELLNQFTWNVQTFKRGHLFEKYADRDYCNSVLKF